MTWGQSLREFDIGEYGNGETMATGFPCNSGVILSILVSGGFFIRYWISFSVDGIISGEGRFSGILPSELPLLNLLRAVGCLFLGVEGDLYKSTMCTAGLLV